MLRMPRNDGSNREGQDMSADCPPLNFTRWRGYGFASNTSKLNVGYELGVLFLSEAETRKIANTLKTR